MSIISEHPARNYALGFLESARNRGHLRDWDLHLLQYAPDPGPSGRLPEFIQRLLPQLMDKEGAANIPDVDLFAACFTLLLLDAMGFRKPHVSTVENDIQLH